MTTKTAQAWQKSEVTEDKKNDASTEGEDTEETTMTIRWLRLIHWLAG